MRPVCVFVLATTLACPAVATAADAPADSARGMFEGAGDSHRRYTVEHLWERRRSIRDLEEAARLAPRDAHTLDRLGEAEFDGGFYHAARLAFVNGLNEILLVGAFVAFAGAVLGFALVRRGDLVASGPQPG